MSRSAWWKRLTPAHFALRNRCRWAKNHEIRLHVTRLEERRVLDAAVLVADLNPGAADGSPSQFTQYNGSLYFSAAGQDSGGADVGRELFRLDSNGHVSLVADIRPGSAGSDPGEFTAYRGSLYFAATGPDGRELYRLDAGGHVSQVADIAAGHASSNPAGFTEFDGKLHFAATGSRGRELYKVDDANRVHLVSDIRYGPWSSDPREFTEYAGKLYFAATGWEGRELFALNRGGQVHQVGDIFPWWGSSNPEELIVCNGSLYFAATSFFGGRTLYRCDSSGHCAPSSAFGDGVRIANPEGLTEYDGNL
ncbi:MAG: hypothetical protein FJ276_11060, partial [Planctomycetes bacterium]|nr:hypothetical protein [Planctomycetota bacterium]